MFATVDAISQGKYFSKSLITAWPLPFCFDDVDAAIILGTSGELAIVLARRDLGDGEDRVIVQIRDVSKDEILLSANFTIDFDFINASGLGLGMDEVGAVGLMMVYVPLIEGEWSQQGASLLKGGEEQHDGSRSEEGSVA